MNTMIIRCLFPVILCGLVVFAGCIPGPGKDSASKTNDKSTADNSPGKDSKPYSGSKLSDWHTQFEDMKRILALTDDEASQLKATFEKETKALQDWYASNGGQLADWDRQAMQAYEDKDPVKLKRLAKKAGPVKNEALKLHRERDEAILNSLPRQKQIQWEGHLLATRMLEIMEPLNLSATQQQQVKSSGVVIASNLKPSPNRSADGFLKLERRVEKMVLTPEQVESYKPIKKKNAFRSFKRIYKN